MGIYEFQAEDAIRFAMRNGAQTKTRGDELHFRECPYCHGGKHGKDKETFSINLNTGQYKCLRSSCGAEGNFLTLARDFDFSLGSEVDRYYQEPKGYRTFKTEKIKSKDHAISLTKGRGISDIITQRYGITTAEKFGKDVIVFPFSDQEGKLRFIKYRNMNFDKAKDKNKEWCEANCMPILFGMKQCNGKFDRLIITEGQIDSLSVAEAGIENAVSVPTGAKGFTWVPYCWDWFSKFKELIVFGDYEHGEITLLEELKRRFPGTIKAIRPEDYKGCKDANEILITYGKEKVRHAIDHAETIPVRCVKELADVKAVDIYSIPKLQTGIRELDRVIGGMYDGQVILLTGKRGDGKSTFMSKLIAETLDQGKNAFAYSGELPDYFFKRWLDFQIAGPGHIVQEEQQGMTTYNIPSGTLRQINDWYRGRAYLYDNNVIEDDELQDLMKTIEKAVMQYGIKLVCIDNLMTALDVGMKDDLYRSQSKFVHNLCKLAKRLNIVVLLVAHPRKDAMGDANDVISGSADITNRVDVVMSYHRDNDLMEDERYLTVTKNRLTGRLTKGKGIKLYYNDKSKRISGEQDDMKKAYGWERQQDGFVPVADQEELPFT